MCQDGSTFKSQVKYAPYFLLACKDGTENEVESFLRRRYDGTVLEIEHVDKEDLDLKNHLSGKQQLYLKVMFATVSDLMEVRREVLQHVKKNQAKSDAAEAYEAFHRREAHEQGRTAAKKQIADYAEYMIDIREYDVPYHVRWLIDAKIRCGYWYEVRRCRLTSG